MAPILIPINLGLALVGDTVTLVVEDGLKNPKVVLYQENSY